MHGEWFLESSRFMCWRRKWQPIPVFFSGEFHGQRSRRLQATGSQRVSHNWVANTHTHTHTHTHCWFCSSGKPLDTGQVSPPGPNWTIPEKPTTRYHQPCKFIRIKHEHEPPLVCFPCLILKALILGWPAVLLFPTQMWPLSRGPPPTRSLYANERWPSPLLFLLL